MPYSYIPEVMTKPKQMQEEDIYNASRCPTMPKFNQEKLEKILDIITDIAGNFDNSDPGSPPLSVPLNVANALNELSPYAWSELKEDLNGIANLYLPCNGAVGGAADILLLVKNLRIFVDEITSDAPNHKILGETAVAITNQSINLSKNTTDVAATFFGSAGSEVASSVIGSGMTAAHGASNAGKIAGTIKRQVCTFRADIPADVKWILGTRLGRKGARQAGLLAGAAASLASGPWAPFFAAITATGYTVSRLPGFITKVAKDGTGSFGQASSAREKEAKIIVSWILESYFKEGVENDANFDEIAPALTTSDITLLQLAKNPVDFFAEIKGQSRYNQIITLKHDLKNLGSFGANESEYRQIKGRLTAFVIEKLAS